MTKKSGNRGLFGSLTTDSGDTAQVAQPPIRKRGETMLLEERDSTLKRIVAGDVVQKVEYWVDPAICKMWSEHDRNYALLNEYNCEDLIKGIKQQGRQEFPAIVRRLDNDPVFKYEVICGARRHWVINYLRTEENRPEFKFRVEVVDISDEEAFRLSDAENREREDISDYERAIKYLKALDKYYKTQKKMADRLGETEDWLTRYLNLAKLPKEIVDAFADVRNIKVRHGKELIPKLKEAKLRDKIIRRADELRQLQAERRAAAKPILDGADVFNRLVASIKPAKAKAEPIETFRSKSGDDILAIDRKTKSVLSLRLMLGNGVGQEEVMAVFQAALAKHYAQGDS
jgi:ParB family chromosome partitioning protein